jgi:hypothetical protein
MGFSLAVNIDAQRVFILIVQLENHFPSLEIV